MGVFQYKQAPCIKKQLEMSSGYSCCARGGDDRLTLIFSESGGEFLWPQL